MLCHSAYYWRDEFLTDFRLAHADSSVNFANVDAQVYKVDLEQVGEGDYAPKPFKVNVKDRQELNRLMLTGTRESQIKNVTARTMAIIGNMYPIADNEVKTYIHRIVSNMLPEQLQDCMERDYAYSAKIKKKIADLAAGMPSRHLSTHWMWAESALWTISACRRTSPRQQTPRTFPRVSIAGRERSGILVTAQVGPIRLAG